MHLWHWLAPLFRVGLQVSGLDARRWSHAGAPELSTRRITLSPALEAELRKRATKLERHYDRITSCRIAVERPSNHHNEGGPYRVRLDITVPGSELVANKEAEDLNTAIRDAFDAAERMSRVLAPPPGEVKTPAVPLRAGWCASFRRIDSVRRGPDGARSRSWAAHGGVRKASRASRRLRGRSVSPKSSNRGSSASTVSRSAKGFMGPDRHHGLHCSQPGAKVEGASLQNHNWRTSPIRIANTSDRWINDATHEKGSSRARSFKMYSEKFRTSRPACVPPWNRQAPGGPFQVPSSASGARPRVKTTIGTIGGCLRSSRARPRQLFKNALADYSTSTRDRLRPRPLGAAGSRRDRGRAGLLADPPRGGGMASG